MKSMPDVVEVLSRVSFPGVEFRLFPVLRGRWDGGLYLQIQCTGKCNVTGENMTWRSRKWLLSYHMTDGEIVQTAFKALLTALEHEAREQFKYRGVSIFDPHYDLDRLVELRSDEYSVTQRDPSGG